MKTLLAKAKATKIRGRREGARFDEKQVEELALAYLKGEIGYSQAAGAVGFKGSSLYTLIAPALRRLYGEGRIRVKKV